MELCKGFVCSETLCKLLMSHAKSRFSIFFFFFLGGGGAQRPVTCERCNICTVTGEGTSFWNVVRRSFSFTINLVHVLAVVFLREVPTFTLYKDLCCIKHNKLICDVRRQKVH